MDGQRGLPRLVFSTSMFESLYLYLGSDVQLKKILCFPHILIEYEKLSAKLNYVVGLVFIF